MDITEEAEKMQKALADIDLLLSHASNECEAQDLIRLRSFFNDALSQIIG
jgi:hypothetical protein